MQYLSLCECSFHLAQCPQGVCRQLCVSEFSSFIMLNHLPLYLSMHSPHPHICHGNLCCFQLFLIENDVAVNMSVRYLFETLLSGTGDIHPPKELLNYKVILFLIFRGTAMLFSTQLYYITFPPTLHKVPICPRPHQYMLLFCFILCYSSYPNGCEVVAHCGFHLHFLMINAGKD